MSALTEQVLVAFLCKVLRLLMEKRCRDLLLRLAKLRSGDMALWNLPPSSPLSSSSSSLSSSSSSCFSWPHTSSRAPCKDRRRLPTQPTTCSWAADSFPSKYCMLEKLTQLAALTAGSPWEPVQQKNWGSTLLEMTGFCGWVRQLALRSSCLLIFQNVCTGKVIFCRKNFSDITEDKT